MFTHYVQVGTLWLATLEGRLRRRRAVGAAWEVSFCGGGAGGLLVLGGTRIGRAEVARKNRMWGLRGALPDREQRPMVQGSWGVARFFKLLQDW